MTPEQLAKQLVDDWLADFVDHVNLSDYVGSDGADWATASTAFKIAEGILDTLRQRLDDE